MPKRLGRKDAGQVIWSPQGSDWVVKFGRIKRAGAGKVAKTRLFKVVGEKLPYDSLRRVEREVRAKITRNPKGVYVAHDSAGCPRYIGLGAIFGRLKEHLKTYPHELTYFSFYILQVDDERHIREVETLLIRVASYLLAFNKRKVRSSIDPGGVTDYEVGTMFFERQEKRGRKKRRRMGRGT